MLTRRTVLSAASVIGARIAAPLEALAVGSGFIMLTDNGEHMTNEMPPDETVVDVIMTDGSIQRSWYAENIMEQGDWDFCDLDANGECGDSSIAGHVAGWRKIV